MISLVRTDKVRKNTIIGCLSESHIDTMEASLRARLEEHLSKGNIDEAESVEDTINILDDIPVC